MYASTPEDINTINQEESQETFDPLEPLTEADLQANGTVY